MSIVCVGLAETKKFSDGYDAIFGKRKAATPVKAQQGKKKKPRKTKKK